MTERPIGRLGDVELYKRYFEASLKGGIGPLVRLTHRLLGYPISVGDDTSSNIMLYPDEDQPGNGPWHQLYQDKAISSENYLGIREEFIHDPLPPNEPTVARGKYLYEGVQVSTHFMRGDETLGYCTVLMDGHEPDEYEMKVVGLFAQALRPRLLRMYDEGRERASDLAVLLSKGVEADPDSQLVSMALARRYSPDYRLHYIEEESDGGISVAMQIMRSINRGSVRSVATNWGQGLAVLEFHVEPGAPLDSRLEDVTGRYPIQMGTSTRYSEIADSRDYLEQARASLEAGRAIDKGRKRYDFHDYAAYVPMVICSHVVDLSIFVLPSLERVAEYDRRHESGLMETLEAFLRYRGAKRKTAESLSIHPNTLLYRLQRISEIGGIDFSDDDELISLFSSLDAYKLIQARR